MLQAIAGAGIISGIASSGASAKPAPASAPERTSAPSGEAACNKDCAHGRIDVHAHYLPLPYKQALSDLGITTADGGIRIPDWTAENHLAMMASRKITYSILSISSPALHFFDAATAKRIARQVNEAGAQLNHDYPGQFGFFAVLPMPDVAASLAEIAYAFDVLNAGGIVMETNFNGLYLGDPAFSPIFDELNRRGAVLYLHPTSPQCFDQIGMGFPAPMIEFPFDTARTAVSLIFSSTLKRRPAIKVILSHGGGALPGLLSRIAMIADAPIVNPRPEGGSAEVIEEVSRLYFDLALAASPLNFQALLQVTSISHLLFGSDYPFATPPAISTNTQKYEDILAGLSPEHRRMIEYRNAAGLFPRLREFLQNG